MKNRFTITISDVRGSKSYNVHQIIKKVILYSILVTLILLITGSVFIWLLSSKVEELVSKKELMIRDYKDLQFENNLLAKRILQKSEDLDAISDKVNDIEELMGLKFSEKLNLFERIDLAKITTQQKRNMLRQIPSGSPIEFNGITSKFGWRTHPILKKKEYHSGLDMKAKMNTKVYAPAEGVVEYARKHKKSGYGNLIIISHNYGFKTLYGHLNKVKVKTGDIIKKGDLIALSGNTGLSSGAHLHYEVKYINMPLEPINFINWNIKTYDKIFEEEHKVKWKPLLTLINGSVKK